MADFTKRRRGNILGRFLFSIGMLALLALVTFGAARAAWGMYGKFAEAASGSQAAKQNLADLTSQEASVQAQVTALNSEEGQEAQLRESYGVALPGEGEIQIVHEVASSTTLATPAQSNFFAKIFRALFVW